MAKYRVNWYAMMPEQDAVIEVDDDNDVVGVLAAYEMVDRQDVVVMHCVELSDEYPYPADL